MSATLEGTTEPLQTTYDALLLDLDGTLHRGPDPVAGAAEAITGARAAGRRLSFVTNNASRTPNQVVLHLLGVGVAAEESEVLTSAQAGARALARLVPAGSPVLVVGGDGLVGGRGGRGPSTRGLGHGPAGRRRPGLVPGPVLAGPRRGCLRPRDGDPVGGHQRRPDPAHVARGGPGQRVLRRRSSPRSAGASPTSWPASPAPLMLLEAAGADGRRAARGRRPARHRHRRRRRRRAGQPARPHRGHRRHRACCGPRPTQRPTYVSRDLTGLALRHPDGRAGRRGGLGLRSAHASSAPGVTWPAAPGGEPDDLLRALCVASWACADAGHPTPVDDATRARVSA